MLKVVLDTNVLISSLVVPSKLSVIREALAKDKFLLISSPAILKELLDVLARPRIAAIINAGAKSQLLDLITEEAIFVFPAKEPLPIIKADPSDDHFLLAAKVARATLIVSGDNHLLSLKNFQTIPIISPNKFIEILNKKNN